MHIFRFCCWHFFQRTWSCTPAQSLCFIHWPFLNNKEPIIFIKIEIHNLKLLVFANFHPLSFGVLVLTLQFCTIFWSPFYNDFNFNIFWNFVQSKFATHYSRDATFQDLVLCTYVDLLKRLVCAKTIWNKSVHLIA